ncbi:desmocollin-3-like [Mantella aurantiaca]
MGSPGGSVTLCWYLALLLPLVVAEKSCHKIKLPVHHHILTGSLVGTVDLHNCLHPNDAVAGTSNSNFAIERVGSTYALYAKKHIKMPNHPVSIGIILQNQSSKKEKIIPVTLVPETKVGKTRYTRELLRRTKRRWSPLPIIHNENYRGKFPCYLERVQSDTQVLYDIIYTISGPGVDQPPIGLFQMDPKTGDLYINGLVDREQYPSYPLTVYATTVDGYSPESPLTLPVVIEDDNDNAPLFTEAVFCAEVLEHSKSGTIVGRVNATDRDEQKSRHTLLRYYLVRQIPPAPLLFAVNAEYGIVTTLSNKLDRETLDHYTLILEVRDMGGDIGCLSSTGTMSITVTDINDFAPVFSQQSYQTEVNENESGMIILRIPVTDSDLYNTSNWRAVYTITQGNEKRFFNITTDPKTNEGLLYVVKGINYEEDKRFLLQVAVANEVSLITQSGTKSSGIATVPVTVTVKDVDEGPECQPKIKEVSVQENQTIGTLITEYLAIDPETKTSTGIRYQKLSDPLAWVNVADNGRITTSQMLDYESKDVPNHKYNVTFLATDTSGKTGTCTLVINLTDLDEHQPGLARSYGTICTTGKTYDLIQAIDKDGSVNKFPYRFRIDSSIDPKVQSQWHIIQENDNTVRIENAGGNAVGEYMVPLQIVDHLGRVSTENVRIVVCDCPDSQNCISPRTSGGAALGGLAILVMVLSALLFALLLCLLMACLCGAAAGKGNLGFVDDAAQQNLIVANTEAPGADVMDPNFKVPITIINSNTSGNAQSGSYDQNSQEMTQIRHPQISTSKMTEHHLKTGGGMGTLPSMGGGGGYQIGGHQRFDSSRQTYSEWQSFMNNHLGDKLYMCGQNEENMHGEDYVVPYNYEGRGSAAGSVGCCSELRGDEDKMDFLNNLEPKFRTLAEVCAKK